MWICQRCTQHLFCEGNNELKVLGCSDSRNAIARASSLRSASRLKLGGSQGKPRKDKFHTAPRVYGWLSCAGKTMCRQERQLVRPCWAAYFYHIIVSGPDQATRYTKKITTQGQAQHLLATWLWYGSDCLICEVNWQFSFRLNTRLTAV